jgi:hypothetical protein
MSVAPTPHLRRAGLVLSIASLGALWFATLLPARPIAVSSHFCLVCGSLGGVNAALNVFLFLPLGVGLALMGLPAKRAIFAMFAMSALIELTQYSVIPGRHATIGDVLANSLGGALGFLIGRCAMDWLQPPFPVARKLIVGWAALWTAVQAISNYGFAVTLPESKYYGQIARALPPFAVFPGRVISANIHGVDFPDTALADSRAVQRLLIEGATVTATVVPAGPTRRIASIVRVADANKEEIAILAQDGVNFVFGVRTGAVSLRLRPPLFSVSDAFSPIPNSPALADTVRLSGRYAAGSARMVAQRVSASLDHKVPVSGSLGWIFWLPHQWFIEGTRTELILSFIWLASLALPFGYWSRRMGESPGSVGSRNPWIPVVLLGATVLGAGLVLVPGIFGMPSAPVRDWLATLAGAFVGWGLAAVTPMRATMT